MIRGQFSKKKYLKNLVLARFKYTGLASVFLYDMEAQKIIRKIMEIHFLVTWLKIT